MEQSNGNTESPHLFVRWLSGRRRRLWTALRRLPAWKGRLVAILGPLVALVGFLAALIGIQEWWRDRPPPLPDLRIVELVPDPVGSDAQCERIRVQNFGEDPVDLRGWRVRDESHSTWALDPLGMLAPGQSATLWREGRGMSLNNTGDHVELLDSRGQVLQTIRYPKVLEGEAVLVTSSKEVETRFIDEPASVGSNKEPELCRSAPATSLTRSSPSF